MVEEIQDCKLSVVLKKWRQKRSLDANNYCWLLCTKIAEVVKSSKDEIYEAMLQDYGYLQQDEDGDCVVMTLSAKTDIKTIEGHWKYYKSNGKHTAYLQIMGSSQYDSKQMAHFLDMIVEEAKGLGIQTETPDNIAKMKALWGVDIG